MRALLASLIVLVAGAVCGAAQDAPAPPGQTLTTPLTATAPSEAPALPTQTGPLRITSPLGRTGLVAKLRIVAQIAVEPGTQLSPVEFFVDGARVGVVSDGPPWAVPWTDENPFERREITVQAADATGRVLRDTVVLPPFEVVEKTGITGVLVETAVYDKTGAAVSNLEPSVFTILEDDEPQAIDLATRETIPTDVVLLVDNSQSMSRRLDFVRRATERLISGLRANDRATVAPFNAHIGTITGPTSDRATIREAIFAMRASGGTAMLDSLIEGANLLRSAQGRRVLVLITDGWDENSAATADEALTVLQEAQATVYVVAIGGVAGISLRGGDTLRRIAERTGGRIYFPPRDTEMVTVADRIATDAHSRYLLTYTPKNQRKDGTWRTIAVKVPDGLTARARAGYFAPDPPPIRPTVEFTMQDSTRTYLDVTAGDVEVYEDGVAQTIDTFQEAVDPVSIVLALDTSGSLRRVVDQVKATASDFVRAVRPEDDLALITFADKPRFAHVLTTNRDWSLEAIAKYQAIGGTALYDATFNALLHLKGVKGRRAIVVMTDGRDENNPGTAPGSVHNLGEVLDLGMEVGATIYAVGLGTNVDRKTLEVLAAQTGGQAYFAEDVASLGEQFKRVVEALRRRYVLSYSSTNRTADGKWRSVEIRPKAADRLVKTAGGYFAPKDKE